MPMNIDQAREAMQRIMSDRQALTSDRLWPVAVSEGHPGRQDLLSELQLTGFIEACTWLDKQKRLRRVKSTSSAYYAKHRFEDQTGRYVPEGTFIAACIQSGVTVFVPRGGVSVITNLSV